MMKMWNQMAFINWPSASRPLMSKRTNFGSMFAATHAPDASIQIQITQIRKTKIYNPNFRADCSLRVYLGCRTVGRFLFGVDFTCELNYLCDKQINIGSFFHSFFIRHASTSHTPPPKISTESEVVFSSKSGQTWMHDVARKTLRGNEKKSRPID